MWYLPDNSEASLVPENESLEQEWMYTYNAQRLMEKFTIMCKPELATINQRDEFFTPCLHKQAKLLDNAVTVFILVQNC